jgi:hypothetical protein
MSTDVGDFFILFISPKLFDYSCDRAVQQLRIREMRFTGAADNARRRTAADKA